jgi:APA family basic amino acid/polyamine antiporter
MIGLAIIVGAGIFTVAPKVYAEQAGPSIILSFLVAGFVCALVGLCFCECATRIPVAGSVYTFAYVALGPVVALGTAWLLALEYTAGAAIVAKSWSRYLGDAVGGLTGGNDVRLSVGFFDVGAAAVVVGMTLILLLGLKVASRLTIVATVAKILALLLVIIVAGVPLFTPANFSPFLLDAPADGGLLGTLTGASVLFYAFLGFDSVSTLAEESRFPRRDLARGILGSLGVATVLYVAVAIVMVGAVSASAIKGPDPTLISILDERLGSAVTSLMVGGALVGLTTGILVLLLGQSRIAFAMSRDGLLFTRLAQLGPRRTPTRIVRWTGFFGALLAGIVSADALQPVVNIGTLVVFVIVCVCTWRLRDPAYPRPAGSFRVPFLPVVALSAVALCFALIVFAVIESRPLGLIIGGSYLVVCVGVCLVAYSRIRRAEGKQAEPGDKGPLARRRRRFVPATRWQGEDFVPTEMLLRQHHDVATAAIGNGSKSVETAMTSPPTCGRCVGVPPLLRSSTESDRSRRPSGRRRAQNSQFPSPRCVS